MKREEALKILRKDLLSNLVDYYSSEELQDAIDTIVSQPSLPSNPDEAAEDSWAVYEYRESPRGLYSTCYVDGFKAGAEWMAGQGVKIGETKVYLEDDGDEPPYSQEWLDLESTEYQIPDGVFKNGDEVDVILRKKQ